MIHLVTGSRLLESFVRSSATATGGYDVEVHSSAEACIQAAASEPGPILVDYRIRGRAATSVLQAISAEVPDSSSPVCLLHSPADSAQAARLQTEILNICTALQKPFSSDELLRVLAVLTDLSSSNAATQSPMIPSTSNELALLGSIPGATGCFLWVVESGPIQATDDATRRLGNVSPLLIQLAQGVAESAGLGDVREVHLFSRESNAGIQAQRIPGRGMASSTRIVGVLMDPHHNVDEAMTQVRTLL